MADAAIEENSFALPNIRQSVYDNVSGSRGQERVMNEADVKRQSSSAGFRLVRIILLETIAVLLVGLAVFGVLWEMNLFYVGLIAAIVIWVCVSPAIEIATVLAARKEIREGHEETSLPAQPAQNRETAH